MNQHIRLGQIVKVQRGREAGKYAIVIDNKEPDMVWLANGRDRTVHRPKKKNVKHIQPTRHVDKGLESQLQTRGSLTDAQLRYALNQYLLSRKESDSWQKKM